MLKTENDVVRECLLYIIIYNFIISIPDIFSNLSCHSPAESIMKVLYLFFLLYLLSEFIEFVTESTVAILDRKGDQ